MTSNSPCCYRRWSVFGAGAAISILPAFLFTIAFEQSGRYATTFLNCWVELLVGPLKYWFPVLLGHPPFDGLHPMPGLLTWLYAGCLSLAFAHPLKPHPETGCVTVAAFTVWYVLAFLKLAAFEY